AAPTGASTATGSSCPICTTSCSRSTSRSRSYSARRASRRPTPGGRKPASAPSVGEGQSDGRPLRCLPSRGPSRAKARLCASRSRTRSAGDVVVCDVVAAEFYVAKPPTTRSGRLRARERSYLVRRQKAVVDADVVDVAAEVADVAVDERDVTRRARRHTDPELGPCGAGVEEEGVARCHFVPVDVHAGGVSSGRHSEVRPHADGGGRPGMLERERVAVCREGVRAIARKVEGHEPRGPAVTTSISQHHRPRVDGVRAEPKRDGAGAGGKPL